MTRTILNSVLCAWPALALADTLTIEHKEVGCVAAGKFPRFEARFDPGDAVARARLHFKPEGWPHWYSVPMAKAGGSFEGVLPKPDKTLVKFDYYISVVDRSFTESRTPEYAPIVVSGPGGCQQNKVLALGLQKAAQVVVSGPAGVANAPLVPVGFSTDGVVAGAAAGTTSASGAASAGGAAAGGGHGALLVVGGLAVVGGGVAIAGAAAGGGGGGWGGGGGATTTQPGATTTTPGATTPGSTTPGTTTPGPQTTRYDVDMLPFVDVSVCAGKPMTFGGGPLDVDANGNFNQLWQPGTPNPNVTRMTGHLDATTFTATFACASGSPSTQLSASGSGGVYRGTFSFNSSSGSLTVTKRQP